MCRTADTLRIEMYKDQSNLMRLLRLQLTAVHQQFFHVLALKAMGEDAIAAHITEVDNEDFKNAMQIIDLLVEKGVPVELGAHRFVPGSDIAAILKAEHEVELRFGELLSELEVETPEAKACVARAAGPRRAYAAWLEETMPSHPSKGTVAETGPALGTLTAQLIALVEQAMVHAFMLRQRSDHDGADTAWQISGAAMLYPTAMVRRGALSSAVPVPAPVPAVELSPSGDDAFDRDIALVRQCAGTARAASEEEVDGAMARLCLRIADECDRISAMAPGDDLPAELGKSPAFASFARTCERILQ